MQKLKKYLIFIYKNKNMAKNSKQTSKSVATKASEILKDNRFSDKAKSVAASALSQTKSTKKKG